MGLFRKKETVHFNRNPDTGKVVSVTRSGDVSRTPKSDALLEKYYKKHPEKTKKYKVKKAGKKFVKAVDDWTKPQKQTKGSSKGKQRYYVKSGKAYPIAGSKKKSSKKRYYETDLGFDPFGGIGFDMPKSKGKKKKGSGFDFDLSDNWGFL